MLSRKLVSGKGGSLGLSPRVYPGLPLSKPGKAEEQTGPERQGSCSPPAADRHPSQARWPKEGRNRPEEMQEGKETQG